MLVLSRKPSESILVAESIVIQILDVTGGRVRIGIEAPAHVPVWREEVVVNTEMDLYSSRCAPRPC